MLVEFATRWKRFVQRTKFAGDRGREPGRERTHPHGVPRRIRLEDLIAEEDDLYGDGVNIAARLEAEALMGGILVLRADPARPGRQVAVGSAAMRACRAWRARASIGRASPANDNDGALMRRIDELFTAWPFFGSRRMTAMLRAEGVFANRKRVQGSQFTSAAFTGALDEAGIAISMDGRGRWMDNVFIERLWRGPSS